MTSLIVALLCAQTNLRPPIIVRDEGVLKGRADTINCTGAGVTCSMGVGATMTLNATGGAGGSPGGLTGDIQINDGVGGFGAYGGANCASPTVVRVLGVGGSPTCYQIPLDGLANPTGDTTFTYPSGTKMLWTFTGSTDEAFTIHGDGAFTGTGDLVHIHKSGTGSTAGADALHVEVDSDTNMTGIRVTVPSGSNAITIPTGAKIQLDNGVSGNSYIMLSGTNVYTPRIWQGGGLIAPFLYPASTTYLSMRGRVAAGGGSATPAIRLANVNALSAGDYITTWYSDPGFTVPVASVLVDGSYTGNAATSSALAADPSNCPGAGEFATGVGADGVAQGCAVPPGTYSLPAATASALGGIKGAGAAIVCSGTDKMTGWAADGTMQCAADQTGGAGSSNFVEIEVDFGATESDDLASTVVTGQTWVTATSKILCAPTMLATSSREEGMEDAVVEGLTAAVHTRVAGTGFTVTVAATHGTTGIYKIHCTGG